MKKTNIIIILVIALIVLPVLVFYFKAKSKGEESETVKQSNQPPPVMADGDTKPLDLNSSISKAAIDQEIKSLIYDGNSVKSVNNSIDLSNKMYNNVSANSAFSLFHVDQYENIDMFYLPPIGFDKSYDDLLDNIINKDSFYQELSNAGANRNNVFKSYSQNWDFGEFKIAPDENAEMWKFLKENYNFSYDANSTDSVNKAWDKFNKDVIQITRNLKNAQKRATNIYRDMAINSLRSNGWKFIGLDN